jgi:hypothetical protein
MIAVGSQSWENSSRDPISKHTHHRKKRAGGVEWLNV